MIPWSIFCKLIIEPIIRYNNRPKLHLSAGVDSSGEGKIKYTIRFQISADGKVGFCYLPQKFSNVYISIKNRSNQAILIDEVGVKVAQLSRNFFKTQESLVARQLFVARRIPFLRISEANVARKMMLRWVNSGSVVGRLRNERAIRLDAYDSIQENVGSVDNLEFITTVYKIKSPALIPYCVVENRSHSIQYESILFVSDDVLPSSTP